MAAYNDKNGVYHQMELPRRPEGDILLPAGEMIDIRRRLRRLAASKPLSTVIACAFDHSTSMLPFILADKWMVPAGVRSIGAAMLDSGFEKTRIVLQQWNKNFRPASARIEGKLPDIFMVSSMGLHVTEAVKMLRNICTIPPERRPLVICGGPSTIYMPWDVFSADPNDPWAADVAVTGEEYILLQLMETLLTEQAAGEPIRQTFLRMRDSGALDSIPGLVYAKSKRDGVSDELIDTGIQRLVGDLDELTPPVLGMGLLERPNNGPGLASQAIPRSQVRQYAKIISIIMTNGCKFHCHYCPIPAYNQRQLRYKSAERIVEDMGRISAEYGIGFYFGTDDNFFNDPKRIIPMIETMASTEVNGKAFRHSCRWGTETTVHDVIMMKDHIRTARKAGIRAMWLGVEDMSGTLVKKGQSVEKTFEAFKLLRERGIAVNPMMMHFYSQPLYTPGKTEGLLNQVSLLKKAGATSLQVLMVTPSAGSRSYEEMFTTGTVIDGAAGHKVTPKMYDGNYAIASLNPKPWRNQFNIILAYLIFYNPIRFVIRAAKVWNHHAARDAVMQLIGMWGLTLTIGRTFGWALKLMKGPIVRRMTPYESLVPMRTPDGSPSPHDPIRHPHPEKIDRPEIPNAPHAQL